MFRIKICGVTTPDDAAMVANSGADAIGLNFYSGSKRYLRPADAAPVAQAAAGLLRVGVFVNSPADEVCRICDTVGLDAIQLHGDEPPEFVTDLGERPVLKAFRVRSLDLAEPLDYLRKCQALGVRLQAVLLDAYQPHQYGGTGDTLNWTELAEASQRLGGMPVIVAGGLTPKNVVQAIAEAHPSGIDTASGVERSPGRKDSALVEAFVAAARSALAGDASATWPGHSENKA